MWMFAQLPDGTLPKPNDVASWSSSGTVQAIAMFAVVGLVAIIAVMVRAIFQSNKDVNANYDKSIDQTQKRHEETREDFHAGLKMMSERFSVYDSRNAEIEKRHSERDAATIAAMREIAANVKAGLK